MAKTIYGLTKNNIAEGCIIVDKGSGYRVEIDNEDYTKSKDNYLTLLNACEGDPDCLEYMWEVGIDAGKETEEIVWYPAKLVFNDRVDVDSVHFLIFDANNSGYELLGPGDITYLRAKYIYKSNDK